MKLNAAASQPHYQEHMIDIWRALPPELKGQWHHPGHPQVPPGPMMVAGWTDAMHMRRPVIFMEHGAGQRYVTHRGVFLHGYSGSLGLERPLGFLCPSETVAARWRATYDVEAAVIGAPAYLERALANEPPRPAVTFSWHWGQHETIPELRSAYPHWTKAMPGIVFALAERGYVVYGHQHPRRGPMRLWSALGVQGSANWPVLAAHTSCLVVDNSSIAFEACAAGRAVVFTRAPWWRDDAPHGWPRFGGDLPGPEVLNPDDLPDAIEEALTDPKWATARLRAVNRTYDGIVGRAVEIAVPAVTRMLGLGSSS